MHIAAGVAATLALLAGFAQWGVAAPPSASFTPRSNSAEATTSDSARRDAIRSIPLDKLSDEDRAKVEGVLSNVSVFRRMPVRVVDCDPQFYLFLIRHPDVVVNIWEVFKISQLKLRETGDGQFQVVESAGASATIRYVYQSHNTQVIYGEGVYKGPLLSRPVKGRGVLLLKTGYVRETNGRYYVTSRMDGFLSIEPAGAELVTKTMSPVIGKTVDNNFTQTLAFIGSLSRTAEVNSRGVQRLGQQLMHVPPDVREQFVELAAGMPQKHDAVATEKASQPRVARQSDDRAER
jgi:hypothetical protein